MNNEALERKIGYCFKDKTLLDKALTHRSYCRENNLDSAASNERLEFLGDAYLDAVVGMELYMNVDGSEGELSKMRADAVCENALSHIGEELNLGDYINFGRGEIISGGRHRSSIIADAMEALIGAIILDGGYYEAKDFILRLFSHTIHQAEMGILAHDYKTKLQEVLQKNGSMPKIKYVVDREEGPDHNKMFFVHVELNGNALGSGSGKNKKEAEMQAAKNALKGRLNVF